jgi:transcription elongation GreA/GreB family factor
MPHPPDKIARKTALKAHAEQMLRERMDAAQRAMDMAQEAANNEEKSSAGDKYETGRAMGHLQKDMHARQLAEAVKDLAALHATAGTVVETDGVTLFISVGLGRQEVDGSTILFLSQLAPLAQALHAKSVGETIVLNKATMVIRDIY